MSAEDLDTVMNYAYTAVDFPIEKRLATDVNLRKRRVRANRKQGSVQSAIMLRMGYTETSLSVVFSKMFKLHN